MFALIEGLVLLLTGAITNIFGLTLVIVNAGGTLTALILFLLNAEFFEVTSHWIEYSTQLFITITDFIFIFGTKDKTSALYKYRYYEFVLISISLCLNGIKLLVYGDVIETQMGGERAAHFFEYTGEMFNDIFAFMFTSLRFSAILK